MYDYYCKGHSLRQVGKKFNRSSQSVHGMFQRRGWELRQRNETPKKRFNGQKYALNPNGYYYSTRRANKNGSKSLMHRDVWEHYHGPIPDGYQVHHRDGNKANNRITNLMLVETSEHARQHLLNRMNLHVCPHCGGNLFPEE